MKEQEYMKITGGIDERFVNEYPANSGRKVTSLKKRATIGIIVAAAMAIVIPAGVFAFTQLTHREKVSVYYTEEGVQKLEENMLANGYTVENGKIRLTVDVEMCDGNFIQGVYTLTALTDDAKEHINTMTTRTKLVYADTGEWIYPVGGGSEGGFGPAMDDDEVSITFLYPVNNAYIDGSRTKRLVFFEYAETGESDGYGNMVVEDYTYYEGIYFDLMDEVNVPTKTLRSVDGTEIVVSPYGVSQLDENWAYPENESLTEMSIDSFNVISADGEVIDILSLPFEGRVYGLSFHGEPGSGNFSYGFGIVLNVDGISSVEINGVTFTE